MTDYKSEADGVSPEDLQAAAEYYDRLVRRQNSQAMFEDALPCNPIPFLRSLINGCKEEGTDYIQTDEAKRLLYVILTQSYGCAFLINAFEEFKRLKA